jgi:hypothetical protein
VKHEAQARLRAVLLALILSIGALLPSAIQAREFLVIGEEPDQSAGYLDPDALARWIDNEVLPIPEEVAPPLSTFRARGREAWAGFRASFPRLPVWNPPGVKRVGLQAGHWEHHDAPDELADLRSNPGTYGGNRVEWEVNLEIARLAAAHLRKAGVEVDILPTTVPVRYRAHAFVSIHADGDARGIMNGFKVARPGFSSIPEIDDLLVEALNESYEPTTGLPRRDEQVSVRMRWYYAFNARRYQHAVAPGVPQAIIETGFLTSIADRQILIGDPDRPARGIANGILKFLCSGQ